MTIFCRSLLILLILGPQVAFPASADDAEPETVLTRYSVKSGKEKELVAALDRAWATYRKLDVVVPTPRFVVRGEDADGSVYVVELFTWRSSSTPDHAPAAVLERWREINAACEPRAGRPAIDFSEVTVLNPPAVGPMTTAAKPTP